MAAQMKGRAIPRIDPYKKFIRNLTATKRQAVDFFVAILCRLLASAEAISDTNQRCFFTRVGQLRNEIFALKSKYLSSLMLPSAKRALALNKAYRLIVREQSFVDGRDAVLQPADNVWADVLQDSKTGIKKSLIAPRLRTTAAKP